MNGPAGPDRTLSEYVLSLLSIIYAFIIRARNRLYDRRVLPVHRLACPVISVGNITAGGTGKTPMTIYIARLLQRRGLKPVIVSRGYGGKGEKAGALVSDGERLLCGPGMAGDEPYLIAAALSGVPVVVGADRFRAGSLAVERFAPSIIIMDDGFQHRRLFRDLDIVLVDGRKFFGNMRLVPRGVLREPVSSLGRAHCLILTRAGTMEAPIEQIRAYAPGKPVFISNHVPVLSGIAAGNLPVSGRIPGEKGGSGLEVLRKARVYGFSGIAQNHEFMLMVRDLAGALTGFEKFPDHHPYSDCELSRISRRALEQSADYIVTTRKDYVRAAGRIPGRIPLAVIDVEISFPENGTGDFDAFLMERISEMEEHAGG